MKLLLFSNSTNIGEDYLSFTLPYIREFIGNSKKQAVFFPYAAVSLSYDEYFYKVSSKLSTIGIEVCSIHHSSNLLKTIENSNLLIIGGGNTFALLKCIQELHLIEVIRAKVNSGTPYIGWSAGSNLACPTIATTNDMPIVQPTNFNSLNLIPFQINPHYTDLTIQGHGGESRETRINEFVIANPDKWVIGLREGTLLEIDKENIKLKGNDPCKIFHSGILPKEFHSVDDLSFLMQ
jgi:dipeptidase E